MYYLQPLEQKAKQTNNFKLYSRHLLYVDLRVPSWETENKEKTEIQWSRYQFTNEQLVHQAEFLHTCIKFAQKS